MHTMTHKILRPIALLLLISTILCSGCISKEPERDDFFDHWKAKAKTSPPYSPTQQTLEETTSVTEASPQPTVSPTAVSEAEDEILLDLPKTPLSVRFIDDDLATSLRTLARIGQQNILISPTVVGKINLHTQETPWDKVFMGIINSYNLTVVKKANLLHVMSMADLKQQVERKSLQIQEQQVSRLITKIIPIEFSDPKTIAESVALLLSKDKDGKPRGSASMDQHSRSLIITETEDNINKLLILVHDLDKATSQILIEAHIVETTKDTARELGIQWGAISSQVGDFQLTPGWFSRFKNPLNEDDIVYPPNVDLAASEIKGLKPATLGLSVFGNDLLLEAQLSALQRDGKLNILSSPSIATLDNSEAVIESGKSVPVQTVDSNGNPTITYKDATLNLTVVPHVISDQMIKLNIEAKKDEVDTANTVLGNPYIIKKLARTQLIVENNATVVLAGLSKETHSGSNAGVPGIKNIPGLGWLFKKDSSAQEFEELLIFITPRILTKPAQPDQLGER